jgi:hypothetical protein
MIQEDDGLRWEYTVEEDGDPRATVIYHGLDRTEALAALERIRPMSGWGGRLTRRRVGPVEVIEVRR